MSGDLRSSDIRELLEQKLSVEEENNVENDFDLGISPQEYDSRKEARTVRVLACT